VLYKLVYYIVVFNPHYSIPEGKKLGLVAIGVR